MSAPDLPNAWNPRPPSITPQGRSDYYTGYSDGWHGYREGSGIEVMTYAYRDGFRDGRSDAPSNAQSRARGEEVGNG